jgi:hypothetical protein
LEYGSALDNVGKLEGPQRLRFNRVYFTIFRAKVWKILIFWVDFVAENSKKLQKLGLEGKISWALNVCTLGAMAQATLVIENIREHIFMLG